MPMVVSLFSSEAVWPAMLPRLLARKAGAHVAGQLLLPAPLHGRLHGESLEGLDAVDRLDQKGLVLRAAVEFFVETGAEDRGDDHREQDVEGNRAGHQQGEQRAVIDHDGEKNHGEEQIDDHGHCRAGEELADVLQLPHPGHGVADPPGFEVGEGQAQQVAEHLGAEAHIDAAGGVGEEVDPQGGEHHLEQGQGDHAEAEHVQGGEPLVHQHLVDDHLEEQRGGQGEELQEKGDQQHLPQQPAVFDDGRNEPGEVEFAILGREPGPFGEQQQFAAPDGFELLPAQQHRPLLGRVVYQHPVGIGFCDQQKAPLAAGGDGGQGRHRFMACRRRSTKQNCRTRARRSLVWVRQQSPHGALWVC